MTTYVEANAGQLSDHHLAELDASEIAPEIRDARGYETLYGTDEDRARLREASIPVWAWREDTAFPGLFIPIYRVTGEQIGAMFKPGQPQVRDEKPVKYAAAVGKARLDVPPLMATAVRTVSAPLWITEGVKKADCLASKGLPVVTISGVYNWRARHGTLGDWEDIPLKDRTVVICFDSDARHNMSVLKAMRRLGAWLESKGAADIRYLIVPEEVDGQAVKGVDDYFHAGGTLEGLRDAATRETPSDNSRDAAFSDAVLADTVCSEALDGTYRWAYGLGWMRWNGKTWGECPEPVVLEEIRQWALSGFQRVLDKQRAEPSKDYRAEMDGWRGALSASKLGNLMKLSKGSLVAHAADFDYDPDALNCQNGILDLRTGVLTPHDPDRLMTKITEADYVPGARHPDWDKALEAVPDDVIDWFQLRMGQALTGHIPPDDIILLLQGGGSNGKSTVMDALARAAGEKDGYHTVVSHRALLGNASDNHPTEMMDFMGARLAVLEETPEAKRLDVNRAKQLAGTKAIKARRMRQDPVTFTTSHTLIINTNHRPLVDETDHGTWRRLALLCFPFTFRKAGEPCTGPNDKPGDGTLRQRLATDERVSAAVLAWAVEGARKWYAAGQIMPPPPKRVEDDTLEWRKESDLILSFIGDCLTFDWNSHILARELHEVFNRYLEDKGHREWTDRTFVSRFGSHDECARNGVQRKKIRARDGRSTLGGHEPKGVNYQAWLGVRFQDPNGKDEVNPTEDNGVPPVPSPPYNREIGSHIGGTGVEGTAGTRPLTDPDADPFAGDPFAEAEADQAPRAATVPAPSPAPDDAATPPRAGGVIGFDLETHSAKRLFVHKDLGGDPYVRLAGYVTEDGTEVVVNSVEELIKRLEDADELYGHNLLGFDLMALARHHGADYDKLAAKTMDTLRWVQTIDPPGAAHEKPWATKGYYGLDQVAERNGLPGKTDDLAALAFKYGPEEAGGRKLDKAERTDLGYGRIPVNELSVYFSGDLQATRGVRRALGEPSDYVRREMRVAHIQHRPTLTGWKVDVPVLRELVDAEAAKRQESLEWLHEHCGVPLTKSVGRGRGKNRVFTDESVKAPLSTNEGREAIIKAFADRGAVHYPKTASGLISLNKDALGEASYMVGKGSGARQVPAMLNPNVLRMFAERGADVDALREMCGHIITVTSSVQKYAEIMDHLVGDRIHPQVGDLQGAGRWAYVRPSVTNMAKRGGKVTQRRPLIADDGHVLICFDLDQVDMRAIAGHCQDPAYMANFAPGEDAHSRIADAVFGRHDGEWRDNSKRIGHGWNYGMSVKGIANSGVELELAQKFDDQMNAQYPGLCAWRTEVRERAAAGEMLDNGFGRKMRCNPDRAWTQAPALMGQGGARDIMCEALLRLVDMIPEALEWLRCVVHDEVVLCVPEHMAEGVKEAVLEAFTFEFKGVPITAGASKAARDWASCYAKD
ncbi:phage/plasmid primase, P4 family [Streptomyces africanus]|uniref:phage/plasmid primase, P4 family n=1 Tax=Streptomyces africanus TaxID=231024 RepID=UPI000A3A2185|nr:phage/plasmid primase, P4 family [Streptomyces africanus]